MGGNVEEWRVWQELKGEGVSWRAEDTRYGVKF